MAGRCAGHGNRLARVTVVSPQSSTAGLCGILIFIVAALACGASSPSTPSAGASKDEQRSARIRVVTWNVQHGYSATRQHVNDQQLDFIVALRPDVVLMQEVAEWDNDMPALYEQGLEVRTGRQWTFRYERNIASAPKSRQEGQAVATWLPVARQDMVRLADPSAPDDSNRNRTAIRFTIATAAGPVDVAAIHLDYLDGVNRRSQLDRIQTWVAPAGSRRIVAGDFNAEPDDEGTWSAWRVEYADAWRSPANAAAASPGFTMPLRSVTGRPGRVDYQWFRGVTAVRVVVDETRLSDHYALIVDYEIR